MEQVPARSHLDGAEPGLPPPRCRSRGRPRGLARSRGSLPDGIVYAFRNVTEGARSTSSGRVRRDGLARAAHAARRDLRLGPDAKTRRPSAQRRTRRRLLEVITTESERLMIASEILLANTLDSAAPARQPSGRRTRLGEVVEEMRSVFADRDGQVIDFTSTDGHLAVVADPDRLRQVLINLIDNAVKYSPDGGRVEVEIEPLAHSVRVAVRDEGIGIPQPSSSGSSASSTASTRQTWWASGAWGPRLYLPRAGPPDAGVVCRLERGRRLDVLRRPAARRVTDSLDRRLTLGSRRGRCDQDRDLLLG